jgi:hypothetical protein
MYLPIEEGVTRGERSNQGFESPYLHNVGPERLTEESVYPKCEHMRGGWDITSDLTLGSGKDRVGKAIRDRQIQEGSHARRVSDAARS